jgi:hypothetical protein
MVAEITGIGPWRLRQRRFDSLGGPRPREGAMSKLRFATVVLGVGLGLSTAGAQEVQDAVIADPDVHQVILENEHVRVISALASYGYKSPMHSHPPLLVVSLGTGRVRFTDPDGKKQILEVRPGTVFWINGTVHSWELLAGEVNVIAVEVKAAKAVKP